MTSLVAPTASGTELGYRYQIKIRNEKEKYYGVIIHAIILQLKQITFFPRLETPGAGAARFGYRNAKKIVKWITLKIFIDSNNLSLISC